LSISDDYFLLYHGINFKQNNCFLDLKVKSEDEFLEIASIFLTINRKNYNKFLSVPTFNTLVQKFFKNSTDSIEEIYDYQYNILEQLGSKNFNISVDEIKKYFQYLKEHAVISSQEYHKLSNIIKILNYQIIAKNKIEEKSSEDKDQIQSNFFHNKKQLMLEIINNLKKITNGNINEINNVERYITAQKFSIGITGIMNAGKSTMLNALLGKEILGTSVIPETANLTIIKYATKEKAIVKFWNTKEWEKIENDANHIQSINIFLKETKKYFKNDLTNFIQPHNRIDEINISQLQRYSSASHSSKLCNLVKQIQLYTNLDFLKESVDIVDTPGLDDPVIQREEITKSYLGKCDILIHLMNVNQVATEKDIEFIVNTLLYHNITKLIIILTRVDTINDTELKEALNYTKESIKEALHNINKDSKFEHILSRLEFIPISGKDALICKTNKDKAKSLGLDITKTGIDTVENSLKEILFGKNNQKNILFADSVFLRLKNIINSEISSNELEIKLLSKSKDEIKIFYNNFQKLKQEKEYIFKKIQKSIDMEISNTRSNLENLKRYIDANIEKMIQILISRVIDDVKYELRKHKTLPKEKRISYIIQSGKKDGFVELLRDYQYEIYKIISSSNEKIQRIYEENGYKIKLQNNIGENKNTNNFVDKVILRNDTIFVNECLKTIKNTKLKTIDTLQPNLLEHFNTYIKDLKNDLDNSLKLIKEDWVKKLSNELNNPLKELISNEKNQEALMQKRMDNSLLNEEEKINQIEKLYTNIKTLKSFMNRIDIENS